MFDIHFISSFDFDTAINNIFCLVYKIVKMLYLQELPLK